MTNATPDLEAMAESAGMSDEQMQAAAIVEEARKKYANTVYFPFSPIQAGLMLERDVTLLGRAEVVTLEAGMYPLMDRQGTLGTVTFEADEETTQAITDPETLGLFDFSEGIYPTEPGAAPPTDANFVVEAKAIETASGGRVTVLETVISLAASVADEDGAALIMRSFFRRTESEHASEHGKTRDQDTEKPRYQISPTTKVANKLASIPLNSPVALDVSGRNEGKGQVMTYAKLATSAPGVTLSECLPAWDREVMEAVTSLYVAGNRSITAAQVWNAIAGGTKPNPSPGQIKSVTDSIDRMRVILATIDFSQELRGRRITAKGEPITSVKIEGYVINAEKRMIGTANGLEAVGYDIMKEPILYEHAKALDQVITSPVGMLDIGDAGRYTEENIIIRNTLIRRIGAADGKTNMGTRVRYESLYKEAGIVDPDKKKRQKVNDYVLRLFEVWKRAGYVKSYSEYKEGRRRTGIDFELPPKSKRKRSALKSVKK